jgi:hypothetical protein
MRGVLPAPLEVPDAFALAVAGSAGTDTRALLLDLVAAAWCLCVGSVQWGAQVKNMFNQP